MTESPRVRRKIVLDVADAGMAHAASTALEELIEPPADAVTRFQAGAVWRVEAYYSALPDPAAAAAALSPILGITSIALALVEVPDENWVAVSQAALPPVIAGRFTVHGSHDSHRIPRGPWTIEIDAGEAFGTAHHATTLGCLGAIDQLCRRQRKSCILDLGCGSGVLAIAAARVWPRARVTASDIDPEATRVASDNARRNRTRRIAVRTCDGLPRAAVAGGCDLIVANILAGPLIAMAPSITAALQPGGTLILSGLLVEQAPAVGATYRAHGLALIHHHRIAGWSTLVLHRAPPRFNPSRHRRRKWTN